MFNILQPSTQKGYTLIISAILALINPALIDPIIALAGAIYGVINVVDKN